MVLGRRALGKGLHFVDSQSSKFGHCYGLAERFFPVSADEKKSLLVIYELRVELAESFFFSAASAPPTFRANIIRTLKKSMDQGRNEKNWAKTEALFG